MKDLFWTVEPEWEGETAFIIAGGPSVATQPIDRLRGRKVIVINSSIHVVPWADICFFGDLRWWLEKQNKEAVLAFKGIAVTTSQGVSSPHVRKMKKTTKGLSSNRQSLMMKRTSLTAAINLAVHLGCPRIVLLGADGKRSTAGQTHHHAPHRWPVRPGCWGEQKKDLVTLVSGLGQKVEILNASPGSSWNLWPIVSLADVLDTEMGAGNNQRLA